MNWVSLVPESQHNQETCERKQKCNWMGEPCSEDANDSSQCQSECKDKGSFCGYCYDPAHCVPIPGIESEEQCRNTEACYLPDGTIELLSAEECKQRQQCDQPCHSGLGCESMSGADNLCASEEEESACRGEWSSKLNLCTYPRYSKSLCLSAGFMFYVSAHNI